MKPIRISLVLLPILAACGPVRLDRTSSGPDPEVGPVLVVRWPRAELAHWEDAEGTPGRRCVDLCRDAGWILRPAELRADEAALLDEAAARAGDDLAWQGGRGSRTGLIVLGSGDGTVRVRCEGRLPEGDPARLAAESRAWLDSARRMRWEEVVEILDLTAAENRAFQLQRDGAGPFAELRRAFLRDKSGANLAIYLAGTRRPQALFWSLELNAAFEETIVPLAAAADAGLTITPTRAASAASAGATRPESAGLSAAPAAFASVSLDTEQLEESRRRLFARRLLASRSRVYARCDRMLLSLAVEASRGALLVVDARDSRDPFIAVLQARADLGDAAGRDERLARRLRGAIGS